MRAGNTEIRRATAVGRQGDGMQNESGKYRNQESYSSETTRRRMQNESGKYRNQESYSSETTRRRMQNESGK